MTLFYIESEVMSQVEVARDIFRMRLNAPDISRTAQPGQFVMVGPWNSLSCDPFLNRPFSIHRRHPDGSLDLLYARVGRGTLELSRLAPGERLGVLGPQGRGFSQVRGWSPLLLVAGGMGLAPLFFLAQEALAAGSTVRLLYGAKAKDRLVATEDLLAMGVEVIQATEDGSVGVPGTVLDLLAEEINALPSTAKPFVAACGPWAMLQQVNQVVAKHHLPLEVSLESRMACGVGACLGCTVDLAVGRVRVCAEGPVFRANEVFG